MLTENLEVTINFHDETPLSVNLPNQIKSKIETTDAIKRPNCFIFL